MRILSLFFLIILNFHLSAQTTWYVRPSAMGQNTGLSWNNAFTDLHAALQAANTGDAVWVSQGTYHPTSGTDRSAHFTLKSGVRLLGGFIGSETLETQRDWQNNLTILDGDSGMPGDSTDNTFTILYMKNPDSLTEIDGLIFQNGNADQTGQSGFNPGVCGGAIFIDGQNGVAYPLIQNCRFYRNTALNAGGAVFILAGSTGSVAPRFWNCRFEQNHALQSGGAVYRNGSSWQEVPSDFKNCYFGQNTAEGSGGGIFFADANRTDTMEITGCTFIQNFAKSFGGAIYTPAGRNSGSMLHINSCNFIENKARIGGCLYFYSEDFPLAWLKIDSCQFLNNQIFKPVPVAVAYGSIMTIGMLGFAPPQGTKIFLQFNSFELNTNTGAEDYTPIEIATIEGCSVTIRKNEFVGLIGSISFNVDDILFQGNYWQNNTYFPNLNASPFSNIPRTYFIDNIFEKNAFSYSFYVPSPTIFAGNLFINNTFGINSLPSPDPPSPQFRRKSIFYNNIFWNNRPATTIPDYTWHIPFENDSSYFYNNLFDFSSCDSLPSLYFCGDGNLFNVDPLFTDTSTADFRLLSCSPAIGVGNKDMYEQLGIHTDFSGNARIQDGQVDLGPLESPGLAPWQPAALTLPCSDTATGSIQFYLANGCEPLLYQWQHGIETGTGTAGLLSGNYVFTITDQQGKIWQDSIVIGLAPSPTIIDSIQAASCATCADGAIKIQVSPAFVPWGYQWSTGDISSNIENLIPETYTVTLLDSTNGCNFSYEYTVTWSSNTKEKTGYGLQLVPNPATRAVRLNGEGAEVVDIFLFDTFGQLAKSYFRLVPGAQLELTSLPAGVYTFLVLEQQNLVGRGRLVVLQ